jgi:hypothetical protein
MILNLFLEGGGSPPLKWLLVCLQLFFWGCLTLSFGLIFLVTVRLFSIPIFVPKKLPSLLVMQVRLGYLASFSGCAQLKIRIITFFGGDS